jgi:hypothetical protein
MTLKIVAFGGSNTFMKRSYINVMAHRLGANLNKEVTLINHSRGNTFCHFGLYKAVTTNDHHSADVVVLEYAINDIELQGAKGASWAEAYEGLVRRIRLDNSRALIVSVILAPRNISRPTRVVAMWALMSYITQRYGGVSIDVTDFSHTLAPEEFLTSDVMYSDDSHYSQNFQLLIGADAAEKIGIALHTCVPKIPRPLMPNNLANSCSQKKQLHSRYEDSKRILKNSQIMTDCIQLTAGEGLQMPIVGSAVLLIYAATEDDGILKISQNQRVFYVSAMRRAFSEKTKFAFLESNILLWQAAGEAELNASEATELKIELLSLEEEDNVPQEKVFRRGSTIMPIKSSKARNFNLIDVLSCSASV